MDLLQKVDKVQSPVQPVIDEIDRVVNDKNLLVDRTLGLVQKQEITADQQILYAAGGIYNACKNLGNKQDLADSVRILEDSILDPSVGFKKKVVLAEALYVVIDKKGSDIDYSNFNRYYSDKVSDFESDGLKFQSDFQNAFQAAIYYGSSKLRKTQFAIDERRKLKQDIIDDANGDGIGNGSSQVAFEIITQYYSDSTQSQLEKKDKLDPLLNLLVVYNPEHLDIGLAGGDGNFSREGLGNPRALPKIIKKIDWALFTSNNEEFAKNPNLKDTSLTALGRAISALKDYSTGKFGGLSFLSEEYRGVDAYLIRNEVSKIKEPKLAIAVFIDQVGSRGSNINKFQGDGNNALANMANSVDGDSSYFGFQGNVEYNDPIVTDFGDALLNSMDSNSLGRNRSVALTKDIVQSFSGDDYQSPFEYGLAKSILKFNVANAKNNIDDKIKLVSSLLEDLGKQEVDKLFNDITSDEVLLPENGLAEKLFQSFVENKFKNGEAISELLERLPANVTEKFQESFGQQLSDLENRYNTDTILRYISLFNVEITENSDIGNFVIENQEKLIDLGGNTLASTFNSFDSVLKNKFLEEQVNKVLVKSETNRKDSFERLQKIFDYLDKEGSENLLEHFKSTETRTDLITSIRQDNKQAIKLATFLVKQGYSFEAKDIMLMLPDKSTFGLGKFYVYGKNAREKQKFLEVLVDEGPERISGIEDFDLSRTFKRIYSSKKSQINPKLAVKLASLIGGALPKEDGDISEFKKSYVVKNKSQESWSSWGSGKLNKRSRIMLNALSAGYLNGIGDNSERGKLRQALNKTKKLLFTKIDRSDTSDPNLPKYLNKLAKKYK